MDDEAWTEIENKHVEDHFNRLKKDTDDGMVILAGRTLTNDPSGMGLVIFEALDRDAANDYMESDPAVKNGVMTATLFPYRVALLRKS